MYNTNYYNKLLVYLHLNKLPLLFNLVKQLDVRKKVNLNAYLHKTKYLSLNVYVNAFNFKCLFWFIV